jgi:hypothetical protein
MFSNLPKLADKNFVLGFVLPVLIAAIAGVILFRDAQTIKPIYDSIVRDSFTALPLWATAIWTAAVLLMLCNRSVYRLLEGYTGPFKRNSWRAKMELEFRKELKYLEEAFAEITQGNSTSEDVKREYYRRLQAFAERFPHEPYLVLPTRFGNVIRAFETYSLRVYGGDSIPVWLRMVGVIPNSFQSLVDDARAEVNFFVNIWLLALLLTGLGVLGLADNLRVLWIEGKSLMQFKWAFPISAFLAFGSALLAYRFAIDRALAWGGMVKSAFDLYLPALAKQLGYNLPATGAQRVEFWEAITSMFLYLVPVSPEKWSQVARAAPAPCSDGTAEEIGGKDKKEIGTD